MNYVAASASGGSGASAAIAVHNENSQATIRNSVLSATGGTYDVGIDNYGNSGTHTVKVDSSQITAATYTIYNSGSGFTVYVGASLLAGGTATGGTLVCINDYSGAYTALGTSCN